MPVNDKQFEQLTAYSEGKLSLPDEIAFLQEAAGNEDLKKMLEVQMILEDRAMLLGKEMEEPGLESADAHINAVKAALEKPASKVVPIYNAAKILRIAAAVIIIAATVFFIWRKTGPGSGRDHETVITDRKQKDVDVAHDNAPETTSQTPVSNEPEDKPAMDQYPEKEYKPTEEDPIETRQYLAYLQSADYEAVIQGREEELQKMGGNDDGALAKSYLRFYKGIAWLKKKNAKKAVEELDSVLQRVPLDAHLYPAAQWYLASALLKQGDKVRAIQLLKDLSASSADSDYRKLARQVLK